MLAAKADVRFLFESPVIWFMAENARPGLVSFCVACTLVRCIGLVDFEADVLIDVMNYSLCWL